MEKKSNWIISFKNLGFKRKKQAERSSSGDNNVILRRHTVNGPNESGTNCTRTRNSFRKSFMKFHNRFKSAVSRSRPTRHTIQFSNIPVLGSLSANSNRVTLQSPAKHVENIYSLDPVTEPIKNLPPIHEFPRIGEAPELPVRNSERRPEPVSSLVPVLTCNAPRRHADEIDNLSQCYWYWGPLSRTEAEEKLKNFPDGSFLIRDSSSSSYLFSISFRSVGRTLHSRIEHTRGRYGLYDQEGYDSITELVEHAMKVSSEHIYCYTKSGDNNPNYPVRLIKPISRFTSVRSLKYLCRFVIRHCTNMNDIRKLPLPASIKDYLQEEGPYF